MKQVRYIRMTDEQWEAARRIGMDTLRSLVTIHDNELARMLANGAQHIVREEASAT